MIRRYGPHQLGSTSQGPLDVAVGLSPSPTTAAFVLLHLRSNFNFGLSSFQLLQLQSCSAPQLSLQSVRNFLYILSKKHLLYILCFPFLSMGLTWAMGSVFLLGFQLGVNGLFTFDELMCGYDNDTIYIVKQPAH